SEQQWRRALGTRRVFLAVDEDGRDVAMIGLAPGDEPELVSMWVAPEARRSGIGVALVEAVVSEAGARPLRLRVMAENSGAIAFYETCGFALTGDPVDDEGTLTMRRVGTPATTTWSPPAERPRRPGGPPPAPSADQ
ncbi:MAG: GNAT family N-acetyltransferase, partial [Aeromicrobium sp.]